MAKKLYDFDDLDQRLHDWRIFKEKVRRLAGEVTVQAGKLEQLQHELQEAEYELKKQERLLMDIIPDLLK